VGLETEYKYVVFINCDGCLARPAASFSRFAAVFRAKKAGYTRRQLDDKDKTVVWLCSGCTKDEADVSAEKPPLPNVGTGK
jgi:hypothetical protein